LEGKVFKGIKTHFKRAFISQIGFLFKDKKTAFITGFIISLLSIVAGWIPDGLNEIISGNFLKGILLFVIAISSLSLLIAYAYKLSDELEYDILEEEPEKRKVLILFLSDNKADKNQIEEIIQNLKEIPYLEEKNRKNTKFGYKKLENAFRSDKIPFAKTRKDYCYNVSEFFKEV
jgi:Asp-tRNA(Asn)/Glu-tRNA(Gln) amidotransferase C subunit